MLYVISSADEMEHKNYTNNESHWGRLVKNIGGKPKYWGKGKRRQWLGKAWTFPNYWGHTPGLPLKVYANDASSAGTDLNSFDFIMILNHFGDFMILILNHLMSRPNDLW